MGRKTKYPRRGIVIIKNKILGLTGTSGNFTPNLSNTKLTPLATKKIPPDKSKITPKNQKGKSINKKGRPAIPLALGAITKLNKSTGAKKEIKTKVQKDQTPLLKTLLPLVNQYKKRIGCRERKKRKTKELFITLIIHLTSWGFNSSYKPPTSCINLI